MPAGDVFHRGRTITASTEISLSPFIKSGRAVFAVVFRGFIERDRPQDYRAPAPETVEFVEDTARDVIDARRGLDYLETRGDIDSGRIGYFTFSSFDYKIILPAVEPRYRAVMLSGCGIDGDITRWSPAANLINFVSLMKAPKLMLHGRYDEALSLKTAAEPLFKLLREPKKLNVYEGGHIPPVEFFVPTVNAWLDETMGPVRRD